MECELLPSRLIAIATITPDIGKKALLRDGVLAPVGSQVGRLVPVHNYWTSCRWGSGKISGSTCLSIANVTLSPKAGPC